MHIRNHLALLLAIVGASFLLYWVSGGFPPATWRLLFQSMPQLGARLPDQGIALVFSFIVVVIQSLAIGVAWALLLWLAIRKGRIVFDAFYASKPSYATRTSTEAAVIPSYDWSQIKTAPLTMSSGEGYKRPCHDVMHNPFEETEKVPAVPSQVNSQQSLFEKGENCSLPPGQTVNPFYSYIGDPELAPGTVLYADAPLDSSVEVTQKLPGALQQEDSPEYLPDPSRSDLLLAHAMTHPGIARAHKPNEDSYVALVTTRLLPLQPSQTVGLLLVADGMGGHEDGKFASSLIIDVVRSEVEHALSDPLKNWYDIKKCLVDALTQANTQLYLDNEQNGTLCGTTVTGALVMEKPSFDPSDAPIWIAHIVNVGDSRTYRYSRSLGFTRITRDHSIVEELIAQGAITPEERYTDKRRNEIYRCIGGDPVVAVDEFTISLQRGDRLLICSDGLWEMVF